jgi:sigma-B regulation protein RsbU (phosphoserine phosphatase)
MEYAVPVYIDDKLVAVVESAVRLDTIHDIVDTVAFGDNDFSCVISDDGDLIYSSNDTGELGYNAKVDTNIKDLGNEKLLWIVEEAKKQYAGFT